MDLLLRQLRVEHISILRQDVAMSDLMLALKEAKKRQNIYQ